MNTSPDTVQSLVKAIELTDFSTAAHTWRVVLYTRALGEEAGLDREAIARLTTGAALHDIGKLEVPVDLLRKPGRLTPDEYDIIKQHAAFGHAQLLRFEVTDPLILDLVRHHHERWDGRGYPDSLSGENISQGSRIFAVIDSFDAMTSHRAYRHDVGPAAADRALSELRRGRGTQYWSQAVDMFEALYRSGELNWILEHFNDGSATPDFAGGASVHTIEHLARGTA